MIELNKAVMIVQVSATCRASDKSSLLLPPSGNRQDFWTGTKALVPKGASEDWKGKGTPGLACSVLENLMDLKGGIKVGHVDVRQKAPF